MKQVLFVCSQNRLRSPTAEAVFSGTEGFEISSAGLNHDAVIPLSIELVEWADVIFVMEAAHRKRLQSRFGKVLNGKRVVCLAIPDNYDYMEPALVDIFERKLGHYFRGK